MKKMKSFANENPLKKSGPKSENPLDPRFKKAKKDGYKSENPYRKGK